jgi:hypothetical protein
MRYAMSMPPFAREAAAIMSLADQLEAAQTRHGELTLQKAETETRRDRALQSARAELFATVPSEFIALEAHAKAAEHSAKFQMSLRIPAVTSGLFGEPAEVSQKTHDDALANHAENRKLMARAIEVRREITAMILKAELGPTDLEHVERLRRYLNMPEQLY